MRISTVFLRLPRHPLLRALALLAAIALLAALAAAGLVLGAVALAVLVVIAGWRRWRGRGARSAGVIEGEFTVVPRRRDALPRAD